MNTISLRLTTFILSNCLMFSVAYAQDDFGFPGGLAPQTHTVEKGDTLYDLSGRYLGDVQFWPQLWSFNPQVTNPHWIYPGDQLFLSTDRPSPKAKPQKAKAFTRFNQQFLERDFVPELAYLTKEDLVSSGEISASSRDAELLRKEDPIWITFTEEAKKTVNVGDFFVVYSKVDAEMPEDQIPDERYAYRTQGVLRITELPKSEDSPFYGARIVYSNQEIIRGDKLLPYTRQTFEASLKPADQDLVAEVMYSIAAKTQLSEYAYVYVNRGAQDGVKPGNRFFVYQVGDEYLSQRDDLPDGVPMNRVGQLLVLQTKEDISLAVSIHATKEFEVGDRLEMYQGY